MNKINFGSNEEFTTRAITLKKIMIELGIAEPSLIKGCNYQEITQLEKENNVAFPKSYKVFLKYFGHGLGGRVMNDIDILYKDIFGLTDILRNEVLIEKEDPVLPKNAFVFAARYGEQFMFFDSNNLQDESPIFYYMENDKNFTQIGNSIFDALEKEIQLSYELKIQAEELREKARQRKKSTQKDE